MKTDVKGLRGMMVTSAQMLEAIASHKETDLVKNEDARYHLEEAEGNLGQFIEELDKVIATLGTEAGESE